MISFLEFIKEAYTDERVIDKLATSQFKKLTDPEKRLLRSYTTSSDEMNFYLRNPDKFRTAWARDRKRGWGDYTHPNVLQGATKVLKRAILRHKLTKPIVCYRGTEKKEIEELGGMKKLKPGTIYSPKGFVSTSIDRDTAREFSVGVLFIIRVPAGKYVLPVHPNLAEAGDEQEVIFSPKSKFRITSIEKETTRLGAPLTKVLMTCIDSGVK